MKLAINQPYFFPYLGFYQLVHAVDQFVIYDSFNYIKSGWINRNRLLVVGRGPAYFTAATEHGSSFKKIRDINLSAQSNWRKKLLETVVMNYKRCPFFEETYNLIEPIIADQTDSLSALATKSIVDVCNYLEIKTRLITNPVYDELESDLQSDSLRETFPDVKLQQPSKSCVRLIAVCQMLGASEFVNAPGGQALYSRDEFKGNGIDLYFLQSRDQPYRQTTPEYYPNLSMIDVLMNCGREGTIERLDNYELI